MFWKYFLRTASICCIFLSFLAISTSSAETGDWSSPVLCPDHPNKVVTGFQLTFDYQDPSNQEDKTIINGIHLGCGLPFQSEEAQESKTVWISGAGNGTSKVFGVPEQKLFCDGYTIGFRLRQHKSELFQHESEDHWKGVKNVKMICQNGEELEGHDEKWDYYPDAEYATNALTCNKGMAVCGVETQMREVKLTGGATTFQLNNMRIQCCDLAFANQGSVQSPDDSMMTTESSYESPFTPSPRSINVTLFNDQGGNETISIKSNECNPIPENWRKSLVALEQKSVCVRVWDTESCNGLTRCYCDSDILRIDETFKMSRNSSWQGNVHALTPCFLENDKDYSRALIFSGKNYTGELQGSVILQPQECLTFYEGDRWNNDFTHISSLIVTDGCVDLFNEEECTGKSMRIEGPRNDLEKEWSETTASIRNCAINSTRVA